MSKITELSMEGTYQIFKSLKEDSVIYANCIGDNPIQNTAMLFLINIYDNALKTKCDMEQSFVIIYTTVASLSDDNAKERILDAYFKTQKQIDSVVDYYRKLPNFNVTEALTKAFFGLIIDNKEYLINELENEIENSNSYKRIMECVRETLKNGALLEV